MAPVFDRGTFTKNARKGCNFYFILVNILPHRKPHTARRQYRRYWRLRAVTALQGLDDEYLSAVLTLASASKDSYIDMASSRETRRGRRFSRHVL